MRTSPTTLAQNGAASEPSRAAGAPGPAAAPPRRLIWLFPVVAVALLAGVVAYVLSRQAESAAELKTLTREMAYPTVLVVHPAPGKSELHLTLPGTVNSYIESSVYAQVSGYVKSWSADIGADVKAGEVLAEISTPVLDQQLRQAQQSVKQAEANLALAQATDRRYNVLLKSNAVSQQDVDDQDANVKVQQANLSAAQAVVAGLEQSEGFKDVRAPFNGIITARRIDVGDYVSATGQTASANISGNAPLQPGAPNQELFRVAQTDVLRVYVDVPERDASAIRPGIEAAVDLASNPRHPALGKLVRTSRAINPQSLTLLSEIDVPNPNGTLLPGGYAQVHFDIASPNPPLIIPGNCMIFRSQGPQVGVVGSDNIVHLHDITIGLDLGSKLQVVAGLMPSDQVIVNPSDSLVDGEEVRVTDGPPVQP